MAVKTAIVREQELADATSHPARPRLRDRADPRPVPARLAELRKRGLGERLLLIAAVAVAGPVVIAVAGTIVLLALAVTGPFLLPAILLVAFVFLALAATGAAG